MCMLLPWASAHVVATNRGLPGCVILQIWHRCKFAHNKANVPACARQRCKAGSHSKMQYLTLHFTVQQHRRRCGQCARATGGRGGQRCRRRREAERARGGAASAVAQALDAGCTLPSGLDLGCGADDPALASSWWQLVRWIRSRVGLVWCCLHWRYKVAMCVTSVTVSLVAKAGHVMGERVCLGPWPHMPLLTKRGLCRTGGCSG